MRKIAARLLFLTALLSTGDVIAVSSPYSSSGSSATRTEKDRRGTEQSPLVVKTLPSAVPPDIVARVNAEKVEHERNERVMARSTLGLTVVTGVLAIFTFMLWFANRTLIKATALAAAGQSRDMREAIEQATRSADAMQSVAEATRNNALLMQDILHKQMRAYVSVDTGNTTYQDGRLRFASSPSLTNTGFTPAKNLRHRVAAAILDMPLSPDYKFSDTAKMSEHDATLSPRQNFTITGVVENRYDEIEVELIMKGEKKRLFVWGTVIYEDIFGGKWETNFCHNFNFFRAKDEEEWKVGKFYYSSHNSTT